MGVGKSPRATSCSVNGTRAHRIAEVCVEAIGQLHDASGDFVEVDLLLAAIALDDKHGVGAVGSESCELLLLYVVSFCRLL